MAKFGLIIIVLCLVIVIFAAAAQEFTDNTKIGPLNKARASPFLRDGLIPARSRQNLDSPFNDNRFAWFVRNISKNQRKNKRRNRMEVLMPMLKYIHQRTINKSTTLTPSTMTEYLYEPTIEGSGA